MKRITLLAAVALMLSAPAAYSQEIKVNIDSEGLLKKIEKSDQDIANPKKAANPATWITRGKVFYDTEVAVANNLYDGIDRTMADRMFDQPTNIETVTIGNASYVKATYPYFIAYTDENGAFRAWEVTYIVKEGALDEAIASYKKAYDLDMSAAKGAGKHKAKISAGLLEIFNYVYKLGGISYTLGNYAGSGAWFEKALDITQMPAYGIADAEVVPSLAHDAGLAYLLAHNYDKARKYFTVAKDMGYERDGEIYYFLYHSYRGLAPNNEKDVLNDAKRVLEEGLAKYPDNANIIECMTDVYVALGENPADIVPIVEEAIAKDPTSTALWNGLGRVYERLGDIDKSIAAFEHVAELQPEDFVANYSVGLLYIRRADDMMTEANARTYTGQAEYNAEIEKVFNVYKKSVAPLEKAHAINPTEVVTVELLKSVTFRLRDMDGMMEKYEKYNELLKQLQ